MASISKYETLAARPTSGLTVGEFCYVTETNTNYIATSNTDWAAATSLNTVYLPGGTTTYLRADGTWAAASGSAAWGAVTGTLADQTDLQTALNAKVDDTQLSGLAKITVGTTEPTSPSTGDLWVDTN